MWLVPKGAKSATGGAPIAAALCDTLRIWYRGWGDYRDEEAALLLIRHARKTGCWIACDCQGEQSSPMLSPAYLTGADTYYLRRLTARHRPEHSLNCPFFREQTFTPVISQKRPARNQPDGYFAVLRPPGHSLAQQPEGNIAPRDSASHGAPRLAKLMWRLLEMSGCARIEAQNDTPRAIASEFAAVRRMAEQIEVAPGIPLARILFTHHRDWATRRIFAVLRERANSWPAGHEPQAFLLLFARKVHEHSIETSEGVIDLATRVRRPGTRAHRIDGPALTLVAIGERPGADGYGALGAWAQPVHSGHRFIPVDDDFDRDITESLLAARRILSCQGIALTATKPLFDQITPGGPVRPAWIVQLARGEESRTVVIEPAAQAYDDLHRRRALNFIGPIIDIDAAGLRYLTANLRAQWRAGYANFS